MAVEPNDDIYNEYADKFLYYAELLDIDIEDYLINFIRKYYPNQNLTPFQVMPVDSRLQDVIRRSADIDNLP